MNCLEFRGWLDDILIRDPGDDLPDDVATHLDDCVGCAREHALALETLEAITPTVRVVASSQLRERILSSIPATSINGGSSEISSRSNRFGMLSEDTKADRDRTSDASPEPSKHMVVSHRRMRYARLAVALAAAVLLGLILFPFDVVPRRLSNGRAFSLLAEASASEARFFEADGVVSMMNEIVVDPVDDKELIEARWLPILAIQANGKPRLDQLKLSGEVGKGYTIRDQSWYDPATHRFARVLSVAGRPLFANAFDGRAVHLLEIDDQGRPRIKDEVVTADFRPPKDPAGFLGIAAGLTTGLDRPDRRDLVRDEGPTKLPDGKSAHILRLVSPGSVPESFVRAIVRDDHHTLESFELVVRGKTLFRIRRARPVENREPEYGWDLAGLKRAVEPSGTNSPLRTLANLVVPNVSVEEMIKRADYPTYIFSKNPSWTDRRQIMDILDIPSPPHRMFTAVYPARDKRHVVLVQAFTFNDKLGPKARSGKLVYTSAKGVKVWSIEGDQWLAEILLSSSRAVLNDPPAKVRTGYLLETPDKTFPALAVNGSLTEAELHELADSLVPAKSN